MESNREDAFVFNQPRTLEERRALARLLPERLQYRLPVALDPVEGPAEKAYSAWPERIYVIGKGGRIEYKAEPGPFGFTPEKAEPSLKRLLGPRRAAQGD
jgi:type I thyroxine 5'-deiodinase